MVRGRRAAGLLHFCAFLFSICNLRFDMLAWDILVLPVPFSAEHIAATMLCLCLSCLIYMEHILSNNYAWSRAIQSLSKHYCNIKTYGAIQ